MGRVADAWQDLTDGHSLAYLWDDFRREARSSMESSGLAPVSLTRGGWRRHLRFARAMFFRLSPARRVLVVISIALLVSYPAVPGADSTARLAFAALALLVVLALEVADRVTLKRDLELARDIQNWLVPHSVPNLCGVDIAFGTLPANTVAGDYFDVLPLEAHDGPAVLFVIADVAGKGIPAGLLMACFRSCLRTLVATGRELREIIDPLHRACCTDSREGRCFTTAFIAQYASGCLRYVNAGHNPPLLRRASGALTELDVGGVPFGTFAGASYEMGEIPVNADDVLVVYTDGVVEAENEAGEEYGMDRLRAIVSGTISSAADLKRKLFDAVSEFSGKTRQHDDMTCLIVRFTG